MLSNLHDRVTGVCIYCGARDVVLTDEHVTKTACQHTATQRRARRPWLRSPKAGGGDKSMSQRTCSLLVSLVLASLMVTSTAHAVCKSAKNICKHIDDCLHSGTDNKDADRIREGVRTRDGKMVLAGAEACARDLGKKRQWDSWTRGCSELEFVQIAKVELELGKVYCDRYSQ
jgi:hypothetical protein